MRNLLSEENNNNPPINEPVSESINTISNGDPASMSAKKKSKFNFKNLTPKSKRLIGYFLIAIAVFVFISYFFVIVPISNVYAQALVTSDHLKVLKQAAKDQNILGIQEELPKAQGELKKLSKSAQPLIWMKIVPVVRHYYNDFEHGIKAGDAGLEAAAKGVEIIAPYADLLGLKGKGSYNGSTQDRIAVLVDKMNEITPQLDSLKPQLQTVKDEMNKIDPNRYAFSPKVQGAVSSAVDGANQAEALLDELKPFLTVLPQFLGKDKPASYLVMFQNDKELRATGGFITAFARLSIDRGRVVNSDSSDIYKIDEQLRLKLTPPESIQKYLPEPNGKVKTHLQIRDSNYHPDFKDSAQLFEKIYGYYKSREYVSLTENNLKEYTPDEWDGIIGVDTYVVTNIIKVLGSVDVDGKKFTSDVDPRCNCPQVVYELENHAHNQGNGNAERKALIGSLMQEIILQAFKQEDKLPALASEMITLMSDKHIQVFMHDQVLQKTMENLDWAGRIAAVDNPTRYGYQEGKWDYWHWNESNYAGAKANLYIENTTEHNYEIDSDGNVIKTVKVNISNNQRNDGWLNGKYRAYYKAYVPSGSQLLSTSGSRDKVTAGEEYGKTFWQGFYELLPNSGTKIIELKYKLPFKLEKNTNFNILMQKQSGTTGFKYIVNGLGDKKEFELDKDMKIVYEYK